MNNPKISIILPIYNVEKYLPKALDSLINQTFKEIEIICVDDCSTDNSLKILERYAQKDKRIRIINFSENKGTGYARNFAMKQASGDYIMFLDPDDWFELNACELAYNQIEKYNNDFVLFNYYEYQSNINKTTIQRKTALFDYYEDKNNIQIIKPEVMIKDFVAWDKIYCKKFLFRNNIIFSETISGEDQPFNAKCFINANSVSVIEKPLYTFRNYWSNRWDRAYYRWNDIFYNWEIVYDYINRSDKKDYYLKTYVIFLINNIVKRYNKLKKKKELRNIVYERVRKFIIKLDNENDITEIKNQICYKTFKHFLNSKTWQEFEFKENLFLFILLFLPQECSFIENIFSVKNSKDKKHKIIRIFAIKFKFKRKSKLN